MRKVLFAFLWIVTFFLIPAFGQSDSLRNTKFFEGVFNYADFNRPFWADMHSTITRAEVSWATNSDEYNYGSNPGKFRPFVFSNLGLDLPVWSGDFNNRKYSLGATLPFFIDVWMDFFERSTAPVVNTAYRFGMPEFMFIHRLRKPMLGIRNYAIKLTPYKHECTHIGDELTLYRIDSNYPITRINVSYNYWEVGLTLNDPDGSLKSNHALRMAFLSLWNTQEGWYNVIPQEGDVSLVSSSKLPYEFYMQYQYQTNTNKKNHLQGILSMELRDRARYGYPFFYDESKVKEVKNENSWRNFNAMLGVRYNNPMKMKDYKVGIALRYYNGINPYGQFRSMPRFSQFGVCLLFER